MNCNLPSIDVINSYSYDVKLCASNLLQEVDWASRAPTGFTYYELADRISFLNGKPDVQKQLLKTAKTWQSIEQTMPADIRNEFGKTRTAEMYKLCHEASTTNDLAAYIETTTKILLELSAERSIVECIHEDERDAKRAAHMKRAGELCLKALEQMADTGFKDLEPGGF